MQKLDFQMLCPNWSEVFFNFFGLTNLPEKNTKIGQRFGHTNPQNQETKSNNYAQLGRGNGRQAQKIFSLTQCLATQLPVPEHKDLREGALSLQMWELVLPPRESIG